MEGKIVVITGGGGGLGRLISLKLADLGAIIVSLDINEDGNLETQTYVLLFQVFWTYSAPNPIVY